MPRVSRVWKDFCHEQWSEAAHAHTQQREAVPMRGLLQELYPVLKLVSSQKDARQLQVCKKKWKYYEIISTQDYVFQDADKMSQVWSSIQHSDLSVEAPSVLRLHPRSLSWSESKAGWARSGRWRSPTSSSSGLPWTPPTKVPRLSLSSTSLLPPHPKSLWGFRDSWGSSVPIPRDATTPYVSHHAPADGNVSA